MTTLYRNARILTADVDPDRAWADALVVDGETLAFVGAEGDAPIADETVDLGGRLVLPGFTDAHAHLLMTGEALGQVGLTDARTLDAIQDRLRAARSAAPDATRLWGRGWLFDAVPGGRPTAAMLDAAVADVPVYLDANDYHSTWVNAAALRELGIDRDTPDPIGGEIVRDADGEATGLLLETAAIVHVRALRDRVVGDAERDAAIERVLDAFAAAGITGTVDMGFDELGLATLQRAMDRRGGALPLRVAAHWLVACTGDVDDHLAQVRRAADLAAASDSPWLRVVGIKLILDGVIDACTAALHLPYSDGTLGELIWPVEQLRPVVVAADAAGLQIALHAIGDRASDVALDAIEAAIAENGDLPRRHRIEHLEYAAAGTAARMARLGITASMQPVHADPAIFDNWAAMLGDERVDRGFAWAEYEDAGALLAFSTDTPTAPHEALASMYVASTRASALDPSVAAKQPALAIPLLRAIGHATRDAAASVGDGAWRGRLAAGFAADLVIVDRDPFVDGERALLDAQIERTIVAGRTVFARTR